MWSDADKFFAAPCVLLTLVIHLPGLVEFPYTKLAKNNSPTGQVLQSCNRKAALIGWSYFFFGKVTMWYSCRYSSKVFGWWLWCCQESNSWVSREIQDTSCYWWWTWQRYLENGSKNNSQNKGITFFHLSHHKKFNCVPLPLQVLHGFTILQLYEGLADQLTDIVVNAVRSISLVDLLWKSFRTCSF